MKAIKQFTALNWFGASLIAAALVAAGTGLSIDRPWWWLFVVVASGVGWIYSILFIEWPFGPKVHDGSGRREYRSLLTAGQAQTSAATIRHFDRARSLKVLAKHGLNAYYYMLR